MATQNTTIDLDINVNILSNIQNISFNKNSDLQLINSFNEFTKSNLHA
jgi:hypothetical protein